MWSAGHDAAFDDGARAVAPHAGLAPPSGHALPPPVRSALRSLLLLAAALVGVPLPRAQVAPEITARTSELDADRREVIFRGNARLTQGDNLLSADEIRYNSATGTASASGSVILQHGNRRLLGEKVTFRVADRSFEAEAVRLGVDPVYLSAARASGAPDRFSVERVIATFREPEPWAPTLTADRLALLPEEKLEIVSGRAGIGRWRPLPLPGVPLAVDRVFVRNLRLGAGYRGSLGAFVELGSLLPAGAGWQLGADLGYFSKRGFLAGPAFRYARGDPARRVTGSFSSGFIHDSGDKQTDVLGQPIPEDRGFVRWTHDQAFAGWNLRANVDYWSDAFVLRDFRPDDFAPLQQPDSFFEASRIGNIAILSALVRASPNRYFRTQQRLPELLVDVPLRRLGPEDLGLYQRAQAGFVSLVEDAPLAGPTLRSDRFHGYYALSRPIRPQSWLNLRPVAGVLHTEYLSPTGSTARDRYGRTLTEAGIDASLQANATWDYRNALWGIDGLRHLLTPRASYRRIDRADRGRGRIPAIDRRPFTTYLPELGLADLRSLDDLRATDTLRLGVGNRLQTRDPAYGSRDLVAFDAAADLRFDRAAGERTLSDLHFGLELTPAPWLTFDAYHRFAADRGRAAELNTGLTLRNGEWWSLRLATHYLEREISEYRAEAEFRLDEARQVFARLHYDARRSRFVEQAVGVRQLLGRAWILSVGLNSYEGRRRESSVGVFAEIEGARF
jgi:LPS-assembly protein